MIAYDGPAKAALIILALVGLCAFAIVVGLLIDAGDIDPPDELELDETAPNAPIYDLTAHRAVRPPVRDEIADAAERVLNAAPLPPRDAS